MTKLTDWYPKSKNPVRIGVYNTSGDDADRTYQHWNGERWGYFAATIEKAAAYKDKRSQQQNVRWRGIAK